MAQRNYGSEDQCCGAQPCYAAGTRNVPSNTYHDNSKKPEQDDVKALHFRA